MACEHFIYEFDSFRFDPRDGSLRDANRSISLTPRASELLEVLLRNAGHLVSKKELLDGVWHARGVNVEEGNVAYTIHHLRHAFGDRSSGRRCIETVPRRGYRFVAPVTVVPAFDRTLPIRRSLIAAAVGALKRLLHLSLAGM